MIVTEIYKGQGLGNQLWCYVTTRVIATDRGFDFGIESPEHFKCNHFMHLDYGQSVTGGSGPEGGPPKTLPDGVTHYYRERQLRHPTSNADISTYDLNLVNVPDGTKIDGTMQDEQYIHHRRNEIRDWLKVRPDQDCMDYSDENTCVINFRGGEYVSIRDVFLPPSYWQRAISLMQERNKSIRFVVITDDVKTAKRFFPAFDVHHFDIAKDYSIIKNASYLILSNSSFAWFPAWLSTALKFCIAPKYWWAFNRSDGYWACDYNITSGWHYLDRNGTLTDYETCLAELTVYRDAHRAVYNPTPIRKNFVVVSSYNNDVSWVPERTKNYLIYDRSESGILPYTVDTSKVHRSPNVGYNIYDFCTYIIDHYGDLPECTMFTKGNVFPRHVSRHFFDRISNNDFFTPIEDFHEHHPEWPVAFFASDGGFCEINNSWYMGVHPHEFFSSYNDFLRFCFVDPVLPRYVRFAPGGNYIVPRENILKLPKTFYENLRTFVAHTPLSGEAHIIERALHTLWTAPFEVSPAMNIILTEATLPQARLYTPRRFIRWIVKFVPTPLQRIALNIVRRMT